MKIGIGVADITPNMGMCTEIFQNLPIDKIVTPLLLKVCLMDDGAKKSVVLAADVLDFFTDSYSDIRDVIYDTAKVEKDSIFVNSSHTHSAPYIYPTAQRFLDDLHTRFLDMEYYRILLDKVKEATVKALDNMTEVTVKYSKAMVHGVACNRRVRLEDGSIGIRYGRGVSKKLCDYPDGLIDPYAECIWFENIKGESVGSFVNYACHGTAYSQYSEICWDYMGYAREAIEYELGGETLFLQGCAGNMSPGKYTVKEPLEDTKLLGKRLADAVISSYKNTGVIKVEKIQVFNKTVNLLGRTTLDEMELKVRLDEEIAKMKTEQKMKNRYTGAMVLSYLERLLLLKNYPDLNIPCEIGIIRLGEAILVFLPGESFIQVALKIKEHLTGRACLVMAYSDCTLQYIPDDKAYEDRGGYETGPDWCFSKKGNAELLTDTALLMLDNLES